MLDQDRISERAHAIGERAGKSDGAFDEHREFVHYDGLIAANDDGGLTKTARSLTTLDGGLQVETVKVDWATSEGRGAFHSAPTRIGHPVNRLKP